MSKKVLIVSSSLRAGSNSEILSHEVERGALAAGNEVEFISLKDKPIKFLQRLSGLPKNLKMRD